MTLFDSVGPSHWGASPTKLRQIMYNIVQKPIETGHEAPGTTVTIYPISFSTTTGVFSMGMEIIINLRYHTEHPYPVVLWSKLGNVLLVPSFLSR